MAETVKQTKGRPRGRQKTGRTISCYIRQDIFDALMRHCEITGQTKTVAIERAIEKMTRENGTFGGTGAVEAETTSGP